ncbi:MAG: 50S ribosomal protein L24 [Planctomycetes bacterium HGW-Planctomycetes-2]|nr:MAG: 50S ribosomal protein L24 [Planctomycetes bacterium HGW-Planctomycetes-2]
MPSHIRKGDDVMIRTGQFRGALGVVVRVIPKSGRVVVKGASIEGVTKTLKPNRINPQGGRVTLDRSFDMSNVSPVVEGKPARVRFQTKADGSKVRVAGRAGKDLKELGVVHGARKGAARPAAAAAGVKKKTTRKKAGVKAEA